MRRLALLSITLLTSGAWLQAAPPTASVPAAAPSIRPGDTSNCGPGTILLDILRSDQTGEDYFGPVPFNHAGHAGMAGSCMVCHHHTPEGQAHPECRSCHEHELRREDISKPSLKGAYHRQCMGCHREWAHGDHCQTCHLPKGDTPNTAPAPEPLLYMAKEHPPVPKPVVEVYETEHKPGVKTKVLFHHSDHIERYGNTCVDCHQQDNCTRCHTGATQHTPKVRTLETRHQSCKACHQVEDETRCAQCHLKEGEPRPKPFDHAETGWAMASYHQRLNCRDCHRQVPFSSMSRDCSSCHQTPPKSVGGDLAKATDKESHHPHDPWYAYVRAKGTAEVCLGCHEKMGTTSPGTMHPIGSLGRAIPKALIDAGAQVKADSTEVNCLVCHSTATNKFDPITLPDAGPDGLCLACHPQQAEIFGSLHDIRAGGDLQKTSGTTVENGTCRTCHPAHSQARTPVPTKGDPDGLCTACHQPRSWAQSKSASAFPHPDTACTECHNPHQARFGQFLSRPAAELCTKCHAQQAKLAGGPHDPTCHPEAWPDKAVAGKGPCLACHVPHSSDSKALLRLPAAQADSQRDAACLTCHPKAGWDTKSDIAILHPRDISPDQNKVDPKLVPTDAGGRQRMHCGTCHNPHGGSKPVYLTRGTPEATSGLCLNCHTQKNYMKYTGHSAENLLRSGYDAALCRPCHAMHANGDRSWGQMLSPRFLVAIKGESGGAVSAGDGVPCMVCHCPGGIAPAPTVAEHPQVTIPHEVPPEAPGYLPLFDAAGHVSPDGQITCRTCHLSHGRLDLLQQAAESKTVSEQDRRAMKLNLRAFVSPNICTQCHGQEARFRFLFFHKPDRREKLQG